MTITRPVFILYNELKLQITSNLKHIFHKQYMFPVLFIIRLLYTTV